MKMLFTDQYGQQWNQKPDALQVEFNQIRRLYFSTDKSALVQHYLNAHKLLWPEDDQHRWFVKGMTSIVKNKVSVFMGSANSSKTQIMGYHALIDFFIFPHTSLSLISSTEKRSLEIKVWGRIKSLFNRAKRRHTWIEGFILESAMVITVDDVDEEGEFARELNRGIVCVPCVSGGRFVGMGKFQGAKPPHSPGKNDGILKHYGDECFPAGTLVDTPAGKRTIESIKVGDSVFSAIGSSVVVATMKRTAHRLCRIKTKTGNEIICTENHPFLTQFGWKKAVDLNQSCVMITQYEANKILRGEEMQTVWCSNSKQQDVLRILLQGEMVCGAAGFSEEVLYARTFCENSESAEVVICERPGQIRGDEGQNGCGISGIQELPDGGTKEKYKSENQQTSKEDWSQANNPWRQRDRNDESRKKGHVMVSSSRLELSDKNRNEGWKWVSNLLQGGCGAFDGENSNRTGRKFSWHDFETGTGCKENKFSNSAWVDSVEIFQPKGYSNSTSGKGGIEVYNLSIAGHPSYSVNGFLVHNCAVMQSSFLDAYSNWTSNENFKGVMAGNPTDISDPLCVAGEPVGGWDSFIDDGKTQEWTSRWYGANVIAFDGRDTPNNDQPGKKYSYLTGSDWCASLAKTHGDDSWQLYQQGFGKPSRGMVSNRVITIGFCEQHKAFDKTVWKIKPVLKIGAIDPAYGGGDRCVFIPADIGTDVSENQIIETGQHEIVPIKLNSKLEPEQQIAAFAKERCDQLGIPPENMFYDSFGRGTLGFFFAETFGSNCPVPVNSGDKATDRPVRFDYFVQDESNGRKRLKRCDEEYFKFVTEMWYSVRECIHSEQLKNLFKEVAYEGQLRLYRTRGSSKLIELETKDEMKERVKKSPDLFDTLAILVEGARRKGFKIQRIGADIETSDNRTIWLTDLARNKFKWHSKKQIHAG